MWDTETDTYVSSQDTFKAVDWLLPTSDPLLWDKDESVRAEVLSAMFSAEYLHDWDARNALTRMGVPREIIAAQKLVKLYMDYPLVQRFIKMRVKNFRTKQLVTADMALALVHRDASDFSMFANPLARVKAQATLVKVLEMEPSSTRGGGDEGFGGTTVIQNGGLLVVPHMGKPEGWEEAAMQAQQELRDRT